MIRNLCNAVIFTTALTSLVACTASTDKSENASAGTGSSAAANLTGPGEVVKSLDDAMGSIGFNGQAASALHLKSSTRLSDSDYDENWTDNAWLKDHCRPVGGGVLEGQSAPTKWGCLLSVQTDGPDTPRGGSARVVQVSCAIEKAIKAGHAAIDGEPHDFKMAIDEECWGAQFVEMAKEQLPASFINAETGFPEVDATVIGYNPVPETFSSKADEWDAGYNLKYTLGSDVVEEMNILTKKSDTVMAAVIARTYSDKPDLVEVFAMSLTKSEGSAEFRYEGRFPFGQNGNEGGYWSNHMRVLASGPFADGAFTKVTGGNGFEARADGASATTINSYELDTYVANDKGIGTMQLSLNADGSLRNAPSKDFNGTGSNPNDYEFDPDDDSQKAAFLTTKLQAFTNGSEWFSTAVPLDYASAQISD